MNLTNTTDKTYGFGKLDGWLHSRSVLFSIVILGVGLRFLVATRGHNFDLDSFRIVAEIMDRGGNVYAETERYNYGPVWFNIVFLLNRIASLFGSMQESAFRYILIGFLSAVDLGISFLLLRKHSRIAAYLFFLNPISIMITGYHNQFDNFAILLGLLSVVLFGDHFDQPLDRKKWIGLFILGLSLMTKHFLFAFPLWLAAKQKGILNKLMVIAVPTSLFLLAFLPYWRGGQEGILQNVLFYESFDNQIFVRVFVPEMIGHFFNARVIWFALLAAFAVIVRSQNSFNSLLVYTCVVVAASPAIANQYLAIPLVFVACNPNLFLMMYTAIGTWYLLVNKQGLHFPDLPSIISRDSYHAILVILLCFGLIWYLWRQELLTLLKRSASEIKNALT